MEHYGLTTSSSHHLSDYLCYRTNQYINKQHFILVIVVGQVAASRCWWPPPPPTSGPAWAPSPLSPSPGRLAVLLSLWKMGQLYDVIELYRQYNDTGALTRLTFSLTPSLTFRPSRHTLSKAIQSDFR